MGWRDNVLAMNQDDWALYTMPGVADVTTAMNEALVVICVEQFTMLAQGTIFINDAVYAAYRQFDVVRSTYSKYGAHDTEVRYVTMKVLNDIFRMNVTIGY